METSMNIRRLAILLLVPFLIAGMGESSFAIGGDHSSSASSSGKSKSDKGKSKSPRKGKAKPFSKLIKDKVAVKGLFTFYRDTVDNSVLMEIRADQIGPIFLCGVSINRGDGAIMEGSRMVQTYPFYFKREGNQLLFMEKNLRIRADSSSTMNKAVQSGISDGLLASSEIKSAPRDDSTGAVLVDPGSYFVRDILNLGYFVGTLGKAGVSFDQNNSGFRKITSFPQNSEIEIEAQFHTRKPMSATALQNPYSFSHVYHYSLSTLPESDYVPRLADDRVGHFLTLYQDYSRLDRETPYVRYVDRWNLTKKNPGARISAPVEPIVYWVENTVPIKYRDAIARGIEYWDKSFQKLGYRNAIIARQMPDDAEWDPADVRYSTVRWLIAKNNPYGAIGPHRSNPFTGQIYDADVGITADMIRGLYLNVERRVAPVSFDGEVREDFPEWKKALYESLGDAGNLCQVGVGMALDAQFSMAYLTATISDPDMLDSLTHKYIDDFLVFVIAHEVGHTLGFRHNFKSSAIYSLEQMSDPSFTGLHGLIGSAMDYPSPNLALPGEKQGDYYTTVPGPYDDWVIEYAYADFEAETPEDELPQLLEIASRAPEDGLFYGTDEDAFGLSAKSIDPRVNIWDLGDDPISFFERELVITREIWLNSMKGFEKPGTRFQKILAVFNTGWRPYRISSLAVPKFVGGLYHNRYHVDNLDNSLPFRVVPAKEQRRAIAFLRDHIFAADAFILPDDLLNKLERENLQDFAFSAFSVPQVDYPLHQVILSVQNAALNQLYSTFIIGRLLNNLERTKPGEEQFTMHNMFTDVRRSIWGEIVGPTNVNSYRRQLQLSHLNRIIGIYLSRSPRYPMDAHTLAADDLRILDDAARKAIVSPRLNDMSVAHFKEVVRQIESARSARLSYVN